MRENSLAKRYAKALVGTIKDREEYVEIKEGLEDFLKLLNQNEDFRVGMETLFFSKKQKKEMIDTLHNKIKFKKKLYNFFLALIEENRMALLDLIIGQMEELWYERNGIEKLRVYSAVKLNENQEKRLIHELEKSYNRKVVIEKEVDKSLIAGIKIQRGSIFYDFSVNGNLNKLKQALIEES